MPVALLAAAASGLAPEGWLALSGGKGAGARPKLHTASSAVQPAGQDAGKPRPAPRASTELDRRRSSQAEPCTGAKLQQGPAGRASEQAAAGPQPGLRPGVKPGAKAVRERDAAFPEVAGRGADLKRRRSSAEAEAHRARAGSKRPR